MNDTYVEVMVARKKNPLVGIGRTACYVLSVIFFLLGIVSSGVLIVIAAALAAVAYFVFPRLDIEYEYLYIDREISIDKIMSKEKRKNVYTVDLNKMECIAPVNSHELDSYTPTKGDVLLFGHRTLQGSPFLRLNELSKGDEVILEWPGIGELNYTVINSTIVPATYEPILNESGNGLDLITCDPIGSTENRLVVHTELTSKNPINNTILKDNPQESNALIISAIFLIIGLIFSCIYPKDNRIYILITILIISAILFYCCVNPIPSQLIYDKIIFLNGGI